MYDEMNNDNIEGNVPGIEPNPENNIEAADIQDVQQNDEEIAVEEVTEELEPEEPVYGTPVYGESENTGYQEIPKTEPEQSGFYHYSYDRNRQSGSDNEWNQEPEKKQSSTFKKFAVCAGMAVVFGVVGSVAFQATNYVGKQVVQQDTEAKIEVSDSDKTAETVAKTDTAQTVSSANLSGDVSDVAEAAMPSIVAITNKGVEEAQGMFYGQSYKQETESAGSGVIIGQTETELLIATNNHVVEGADELSVCFTVEADDPENLVVEAQVKGTDPDNDLAVIAVSLEDIADDVKGKIKVIEIGDSSSLKVGQQVIAIGNALGYGQSVTVGYVSALNREVTVDNVTNDLIQTDAAINFGNSGGALLNASGQLIGINSVKAAASGVEGMGYAIPMETAEPILNDLMNRTTRSKVAEAEKGYLGITPADVSEEAREIYSMPAGAFVYEVSEESAAAAAGISKGDIIVKIDGVAISSKSDLFKRMEYLSAGETVEVVVATAENGEYKERTVNVTLGKRPEGAQTTESQDQQGGLDSFGEGYGYEDEYGNGIEDYFTFPR